MISATCENSDTYQYGAITTGGDVAVDYGTVRRVTNSTATFSVTWRTPATVGASSSQDTSVQSSQSFSSIRIFDVFVMVVLILIVIIILLGFWKVFTVLNRMNVALSQKERSLSEFYE